MPLSVANQEALARFHETGAALLHNVLSPAQLGLLRRACADMVSQVDEQIDAGGGDLVRPLTHKGRRYFIDFRVEAQPEIHRRLIDSAVMAEITSAIFPAEEARHLYHHKQQFVVKCPGADMEFSWHQDSGYMWGADHVPWVTCWAALDDMHVGPRANGTLFILPHQTAPGSGKVGTLSAVAQHDMATDGTNDLIGYRGSDPGEPVLMKAGGLAVFSSTTFHRSGRNDSNADRRAWLCTFSPATIELKEGTTRQNVPVHRSTQPRL